MFNKWVRIALSAMIVIAIIIRVLLWRALLCLIDIFRSRAVAKGNVR
jgi:hypothetical protein